MVHVLWIQCKGVVSKGTLVLLPYTCVQVYNYLLQFNEHKLKNGVAKITPLENTDHSCKTIVITISYSTPVHAHVINNSASPFEIQMVATWYASYLNFSVSATVQPRLTTTALL